MLRVQAISNTSWKYHIFNSIHNFKLYTSASNTIIGWEVKMSLLTIVIVRQHVWKLTMYLCHKSSRYPSFENVCQLKLSLTWISTSSNITWKPGNRSIRGIKAVCRKSIFQRISVSLPLNEENKLFQNQDHGHFDK